MSIVTSKLIRVLVCLIALVLILMPFHAFLTVWLSAGLGHYTALRLWKEFIILLLLGGSIKIGWPYLLRLRQADIIWKLIAGYLLLTVLCGLIAWILDGVTASALAYGLITDTRFFVFFGLVALVMQYSDWLSRHWRQLLLIPAGIVILFGVLQYAALPADFLRHFGYGPDTIPVSATVDQKINYLRVGSTLRGANPLGAYLVLIVTVLAALIIRRSNKAKRGWYILAVALALFVLGVTYSRSAWIGTVISLALLVWWSLDSAKLKRWFLISAALLMLLSAGLLIGLRHNDSFENTVFHTDEKSHASISSNAGHASAIKAGIDDIWRNPLGSGTGSAGPASTYNKSNHAPRIAENYFIQVGQETGWLGIILFVTIMVRTAQLLWIRRANTLALALLASLIGLSVVNLLSHAWADDTLAYIWWGFAGIAIGLPLVELNKKRTKNAKHVV